MKARREIGLRCKPEGKARAPFHISYILTMLKVLGERLISPQTKNQTRDSTIVMNRIAKQVLIGSGVVQTRSVPSCLPVPLCLHLQH